MAVLCTPGDLFGAQQQSSICLQGCALVEFLGTETAPKAVSKMHGAEVRRLVLSCRLSCLRTPCYDLIPSVVTLVCRLAGAQSKEALQIIFVTSARAN